jgi:phosphate:Na+ symporter
MWLNVVASVLALSAFLGGLYIMRSGLEGMGHGRLPSILHRFVSTPTKGIITGLLTTTLLQSSAAITAITVGMVASGSMVFRDAVGIILGSNVGSTITPQLLTLNLWIFVAPFLLIGIIGYVFGAKRFRHASMALVGFATIFVALQALSHALHPLAQTPWFRNLLAYAGHHVLLAILTGVVASAMIQSSTATTVITMALAMEFVIPLTGGIAIVLGANVGTCATSVLAAVGQTRPAQQVALSHVLLNVSGVLIMLPFMNSFTDLMAAFATNPAQQIANAHTAFNILSTLLVWPLASPFSRLVEVLLPDQRHA